MMSALAELRRFLGAALVHPAGAVPPAPAAGELRRRRLVALVTILLGASILALTLRAERGSAQFFWLGLILAAVWTVGAVASGPLSLGTGHTRSGGRSLPILQSVALATLLLVLFLTGALAVAHVPLLRDPVLSLLEHARAGATMLVVLLTVVNGIAEELFFRGALYAAAPARYPILTTTVIYGLTTVGTGIPLLVLAAILLGLVTALQRRVTGGILGPIITHVVWSTAMLLFLPSVLNLAR